MKRKKGFTLIELLVVIAIIALLMAILMPALDRVRKQAKEVICRTMLKQWGLMFNMYADQHDNKFMSGWTNYPQRNGAFGEGDWMVALEPYYGGKGIRYCPVAKKHGTNFIKGYYTGSSVLAWGRDYYLKDPATGNNITAHGSYGANTLIYDFHPDWPDITPSGAKDTKNCWRGPDVKNGGNIPLFFDCACYGVRPASEYSDQGGWDTSDDPGLFHDQPGGGLGRRCCINRHQGRVDYTFLDWSVRRIGLRGLFRLKWHRNYPTFPPDNPWVAKGFSTPDYSNCEWLKDLPDDW